MSDPIELVRWAGTIVRLLLTVGVAVAALATWRGRVSGGGYAIAAACAVDALATCCWRGWGAALRSESLDSDMIEVGSLLMGVLGLLQMIAYSGLLILGFVLVARTPAR